MILWREVWRDRPWLVMPVRVVADEDDLLALYIPESMPLGFPEGSWPWEGGHPWSRKDRWQGHGVLTLFRPGAAHSVWVFWRGPEREFAGWYLNLCRPFERTARGIDTLDHELDLIVRADLSYELKDDERLEGWIERGRWTVDEVAAIRAEGARLAAKLDAGERWWDARWAEWRPDPAWSPPQLPPGWDS